MSVATDPAVRVSGRTPDRSPAARVAWLLPPVVLALYAVKPLGPVKDPDAYWHVVSGDHLVRTGQFVLDDPFGAATEKGWILNQWLSEVVMHWAHAAYGLPGVAFLLCLGSLLIGVSVYAACRRSAGGLPTAFALALVFLALSGSLSPRPQLVTFALTAVTTNAWLQTREDGRARWWLVPLAWLWACSHGMWFMGIAVGGLVITGMAFERRASVRSLARLALIPVLSVAAAAVTPVGPRLLSSPFQVGEVTPYISEWQRPGLGDPAVLAVLVLVLAVAADLLRDRRVESTTVLLALAGTSLTLMSARTVGLGAVILAPLAASALQNLMRQPPASTPRRERVSIGVSSLFSLLVVAAAAPSVAANPAIGPNGLNRALSALPTGTVLCNDQVDGGWLMLEHPGLKQTIDTRVELYTVEHIRAYLGFIAGEPGWQSYPRRVGCSYAVLPSEAGATRQMRISGNWHLVDESTGYELFVAAR